MYIIKKLFDEINDNNFIKFKALKEKDITRGIYLEKICDYLDAEDIKKS